MDYKGDNANELTSFSPFPLPLSFFPLWGFALKVGVCGFNYQAAQTHLFPRQGSLVLWSQRGPVHPSWHSQVKPDWVLGWHVPWAHTFLWHGSQPGRMPVCMGTFRKSCSSLLM